MRGNELRWLDHHGEHGGVIGFDEMRLEQPEAPDDACALVEAGHENPQRRGEYIVQAAFLDAEQAVYAALVLLDSAKQWRRQHSDSLKSSGTTDDQGIRHELHRHAASVEDMTFWIQNLLDGRFRATEIETDISGNPAISQREAMENYWTGNLP